jgi:hypothetical protein
MKGMPLLHAELGAAQHAKGIGAAAALAVGQVEAAFEAADFQAHGPDFAEHDQFAFDGGQLVVGENQLVAAEQDVGKVLG